MPRISGVALAPAIRTVMIFIDGGYLRENLKKKWGVQKDEFSIKGFESLIGHRLLPHVPGRWEHIRTYYYDAIIDESTIEEIEEEEREKLKRKREKQKAFFSKISDLPFCDVRLGRLVYSEKEGFRQKGVDIRMTIDMLSKAYDGHYEFAILVAGDGDFESLVDAVKDAGRRVIGAYYQDNISPKLREMFDLRIILTREALPPADAQ